MNRSLMVLVQQQGAAIAGSGAWSVIKPLSQLPKRLAGGLPAMTESAPLDADYFSAADESDNAGGQVSPRDRRCWCRSFSRHEWSSVLRRPI